MGLGVLASLAGVAQGGLLKVSEVWKGRNGGSIDWGRDLYTVWGRVKQITHT